MEVEWNRGRKTNTILGELQSVDGYMNIALEKCEEHVNGVKKRSYGDAFIRGNNGTAQPRLSYFAYLHLLSRQRYSQRATTNEA